MHYRWHPAFDHEVDVLYEEQRRGDVPVQRERDWRAA
jgi:hypothetical protein